MLPARYPYAQAAGSFEPGVVLGKMGTRRVGRLAITAGGLGLALLAGSCMRGEVEKKVAFDDKDHAAWIAKGKSGIDGEGFLRRPNGSLSRCSGGVVYLVPATAYFREWVEVYRSGATIANASSLHESHSRAIRKTQCDMQGRFQFSELPAGKWIAVTRVTFDGAGWNNDSTLVTEVETRQGEIAKAILSNPNRI